MPGAEHVPHVIEVPIAGADERIRVEGTPDGLLLSNGSRWRQPLTLEEAWRLAEALDEMATGVSDSE